MSKQHHAKLNSRTLTASVLAVVFALSSSAALARAMSGPPDESEDAPGKTEACRAIGCAGGNRACGTVSGKLTSGAPPFVGEISVSWTCYEVGPTA
ncbi:MAG: hypothetical protein ABJB74_23135 [Gemmatimonas sp.]